MSPEQLGQGGKRYLRTRRSERYRAQQAQAYVQAQVGGGSWIKRKVLPKLAPWFSPSLPYNPEDSYFPCPRITFLIDKPKMLVCQICRESRCRVKSSKAARNSDDTTFAIMPCGHAAGSQCLKAWLSGHDFCPFCRAFLTYTECGHAIEPRPLTTEMLYFLPRTVPDNGHVPRKCWECMRQELLAESRPMFGRISLAFQEARRRYHETQRADDEETMLAARERFETVLHQGLYKPHIEAVFLNW